MKNLKEKSIKMTTVLMAVSIINGQSEV